MNLALDAADRDRDLCLGRHGRSRRAALSARAHPREQPAARQHPRGRSRPAGARRRRLGPQRRMDALPDRHSRDPRLRGRVGKARPAPARRVDGAARNRYERPSDVRTLRRDAYGRRTSATASIAASSRASCVAWRRRVRRSFSTPISSSSERLLLPLSDPPQTGGVGDGAPEYTVFRWQPSSYPRSTRG